MKNFLKSKNLNVLLLTFLFLGFASNVSATDGTINSTNHYAQVCEDTDCAESSTSTVNFGYFTTNSDKNVVVHDDSLTGYIWGESFGWVVLNCSDTPSGCSTSSFKVSNDGNGNLSGYAWGENAGWIHFGPFANSSTQSLKIDSDGNFNGYVWSENFGWIKFDCSLTNYCVKTSWIPESARDEYGFDITTLDTESPFTILPPVEVPKIPLLPNIPDLIPNIIPDINPPLIYPPTNTDNPLPASENRYPRGGGTGALTTFFDYMSDRVFDNLDPIIKILIYVRMKVAIALDTNIGYVFTKFAPTLGLVFGTIVSIIPELMLNPLTLSERALMGSRLWKFLAVLLGRKHKRDEEDEYHPKDVHILGPSHHVPWELEFISKLLMFVGFIVASAVFWVYPNTHNTIIFVLYIILFILNISIHRPKDKNRY